MVISSRVIGSAIFAAAIFVLALAFPVSAETAAETDTDKLISTNCRALGGTTESYQGLCAATLRQGAERGNADFVERLEIAFKQCGVGKITAPENRKAAFQIKSAVDWTRDDVVTVHRYATNCLMKIEPQLSLGFALQLSGYEVLDTYWQDILQARAVEKQLLEAKEASERQRQAEDKRRAALAEQGYNPISLLELKAHAPRLVGSKVAVRGMLQIFQGDMAYLGSRADDMTGVVVSIRDAAASRRMDLLARCSQFARPCQAEVRGKVVAAEPNVMIMAD
jgi:hypothetical protein